MPYSAKMLDFRTKEYSASPVPDLLIGIDFGMTGTAVAYASLGAEGGIKELKDWSHSDGYHPKVPSVISYENGKVSAWGFEATTNQAASDLEVKSFFKGSFDHGDRRKGNARNSLSLTGDSVEKWLTDYLKQLYAEIRNQLEKDLPKGQDWESTNIRFMFSHPTTWSDTTVNRFRHVIQASGFKALGQGHSGVHEVQITLDEAEAAAACYFAESELPKVGEYVMVADLGGGTSDVAIFKVERYMEKSTKPKLIREARDQGQNVGSSKIDEGFGIEVRRRLQEHNDSSDKNLDDSQRPAIIELQVNRMAQSEEFMSAKHSFGKPPVGGLKISDFSVDIPFMAREETDVRLGIKNGLMRFSPDEIFPDLFKSQCDKVWLQFSRQIESLTTEKNNILENLHLVLAGGLGSSRFVKSFLEKRFEQEYDTVLQHCSVLDYPQLAVCRGIVHDALRKIQGQGIFQYKAQLSYGVLEQKGSEGISFQWFLSNGDIVTIPSSKQLTFKIKAKDVQDTKLFLLTTTDKVPLGRGSIETVSKYPKGLQLLTENISMNKLEREKVIGIPWPRCHVDVGMFLDYNSIRSTVSQNNKAIGEAVYIRDEWHLPPSVGGPEEEDAPRPPPNEMLWKVIRNMVGASVTILGFVATILKFTGENS